MNNHFDEKWEVLQKVSPSQNQKDRIKQRIWQTIHETPPNHNKSFQWKGILAASLLFLICGTLLWTLLQDHSNSTNNAAIQQQKFEKFSWNLEDIYTEKIDGSWALYRKGGPLQVGTISEVTETEMNKIVNGTAIYQKERLENFPYPTNLYIEHMKRENVAIRYHFFIPITEEKWAHFTFDYPLVEHAEVFYAMSTLKIQGIRPVKHDEALYVRHGYENLLYPTEIQPISITPQKERYYWKMETYKPFYKYIKKVQQDPNWKEKSTNGLTYTFASVDGYKEVTITFNGKDITYEFVYLNQE